MRLQSQISILLLLLFAASEVCSAEHFRGAAQQQQGGQQQQQQGGGGGGGAGGKLGQAAQGMSANMPDNSKQREAAQKSIKDGDEVRKAITKTSEQFSQGANKLVDSFNSTLSSLSKSSGDEEFKDTFKQLKDSAKPSSESSDAMSAVVEQIVSGLKAQADTLVKKAQIEAAATSALPRMEIEVKPTTSDKLAAATDGSSRNSPLGMAQNTSSEASTNIPSLKGGAGVSRDTASGSASGGGLASGDPNPSIGSHARGVNR